MSSTKRVVITGGPGTGKSTILGLLAEQNYTVHQEVSRSVIKEELKNKSEILPWRDLSAFSDKVFDGQTAQYRNAEEGATNFYDRGLIDVIAYLKKGHLPYDKLQELAHHYPYHQTVFIAPPWPEIYSQDAERREDLEGMQAIHDAIVNSYLEFGYKIVEIPKLIGPG